MSNFVNLSFEEKAELLEEFTAGEQFALGIEADKLLEYRHMNGVRKIMYDCRKDVIFIDIDYINENDYVYICMDILRELRHQYQWRVIHTVRCKYRKNRNLLLIEQLNLWKEEWRDFKRLTQLEEYPSTFKGYCLRIVKDAENYSLERARLFGWQV